VTFRVLSQVMAIFLVPGALQGFVFLSVELQRAAQNHGGYLQKRLSLLQEFVLEELCGIGECGTAGDVLSVHASGSMVPSAPAPSVLVVPRRRRQTWKRGGLLSRTTTVGGRAVVDRQSGNAALHSLKL
jgi:hypothetical protein